MKRTSNLVVELRIDCSRTIVDSKRVGCAGVLGNLNVGGREDIADVDYCAGADMDEFWVVDW